MGLAPYGEGKYVDQVRALIHSLPGGQYRLEMKYFDFLKNDRMYSDQLVDLFGQPVREEDGEMLPFHKDMAKSLQIVLEEILHRR